MSKRKVAVVTGARSEYGLLFWPLKELQQHPDFELQLIVTGAHLKKELGYTVEEIEKEGFHINAKIEILGNEDSTLGISMSLGRAVTGIAEALDQLNPDILLILGDRYEILAAAQAALIAGIPIAHIHGGELTEGAVDDSIRHAITKMANLHFVAAEPYQRRVIQLGEQPQFVYNVGAPGLDHLNHINLLDRDQLEKSLGFELGECCFLATYHSPTLSNKSPEYCIKEWLKALDRFPKAKIIMTYPGADTEWQKIISLIEGYAKAQPNRVFLTQSLGQLKYLSALNCVDLVVGNTSSGLIEAPSFQTPTVNIGNRQKGRLKASSVIDCGENADSIQEAIKKALSKDFQKSLKDTTNPYGNGTATKQIIPKLAKVDLKKLRQKKFYDLNQAF
ncbi:MAG: UDP-N-acetylglucosamine 2-epimerase [Nitrospinota bacterium]